MSVELTDVKSVEERLFQVAKNMQSIKKQGKNTTQNYEFARAEDVIGAVKKELVKEGLRLVGDVDSVEISAALTTSNKPSRLVLLKMKYWFIAGDSGENGEELTWFAEATDYGDKALNKAYTISLRTFLTHQFQIPVGWDDPEADESIDKAVKRTPDKKLSKAKLAEVTAYLDKLESPSRVLQAVGVDEVSELRESHLPFLREFINKAEEATR